MKQIQLFKPIYAVDECLDGIRECLENSWTGQGFKTLEFESKFKLYTSINNAHFLNSATSGLHLALELIIKSQQKSRPFVVTSPLSFISTSHIINHAGLEPWFLDIDDTLTLDPEKLETQLKKDRSVIAAVIFVTVGGSIGNLLQVSGICARYGIPLILDASHAMGTWIGSENVNRHIGTQEGRYVVFSFQSVKNLPTGDSGMLCCQLDSDDKHARKLSWLGITKDTYTRQTSGIGNWDYDVVDYGWKYHGNSVMAAIAIAQLPYLQNDNNIRRTQADKYDRELSPFYIRINIPDNQISSRHLYQVRIHHEDRDAVIIHARENGIQLGVHYKAHTEYNLYVSQRQFVPVATKIWQELISLPIGPHLDDSDTNYIIEVMNDYFK